MYESYNKVVNKNKLFFAPLHGLYRHIMSPPVTYGDNKVFIQYIPNTHAGKTPSAKSETNTH